MAMTLPLPPQNMPAEVYSYLFQMVQLLNLSADSISTGTAVAVEAAARPAAPTGGGSSGGISSEEYEELKSLIIKTADEVYEAMDKMSVDLEGTYVAQTEFGSYVEELNAYLVANPDKVTQYYSFVGALETAFNEYKVTTEGYIRTGIVTYENGLPILGVAVGQNLSATKTDAVDGKEYDVVEEIGFRAIFTAKELSFWQGDVKVAYLNNSQLYVTNIVALEKIKLGSWHIGSEDGFFIRWIGGAT